MAPYLDLCRLCGQKKKMRVEIFSTDLLRKITETLNLIVTMEDPLPKHSCLECQRAVENFYVFKLRCSRAEIKLRDLIASGHPNQKQVSIKEEHQPEQAVHSYFPAEEHNYFATASVVKTEVHETPVDAESTIVDNPADDIEELVYSHALTDVKQPIVEVIAEPCVTEVKNIDQLEDLVSVVKVDVVVQETKPLLPPLKSVYRESELPYDLEIAEIDDEIIEVKRPPEEPKNADGFSESDFFLKDNEIYSFDIDEEEIEAAIIKKKNPLAKFKCPKCKRSFKFFKALRKHRKIHEGERKLSCINCIQAGAQKSTFSTPASLGAHINRVHKNNELPFCCRSCSVNFSSFKMLKNHLLTHYTGPRFACDTCSKQFHSKSKLAVHTRLHTGEKPCVCEICLKRFRWASNLQAHLATHFDEKDILLCSECGSEFKSMNGLLLHVASVHRLQRYSCAVCAKEFSQFASLKRHEDIHKSLDYGCYVCGRRFPTMKYLNTHFSMHFAEKAFKCIQCMKCFKSLAQLNSHRKIHDKQHKCSTCGHVFAKKQILVEHMRAIHMSIRHKCPVEGCKANFTQRTPLTRHFQARHPGMKLLGRLGIEENTITYQCTGKLQVMELKAITTNTHGHFIRFICFAGDAPPPKTVKRKLRNMILYYNPASAPCRAVMMLLSALNMKADMVLINFETGDHLTPDFLKMNPQHTVPLIVDDGFYLSESRAILGYIAEKYAMDMAMYPSDPMARGVVNQRLFFDIGTLYQRLWETYLYPTMNGIGKMNEDSYQKTLEAFGYLNTFLGEAPYMAGNKMTIADLSLMATISSADAMGLDLMPYPKVMAWFNRCKMEIPNYMESNGEGAAMLGGMVKGALNLK